MYPVMAIIGLMLLTWGIAVWATWSEDSSPEERPVAKPRKEAIRNVA